MSQSIKDEVAEILARVRAGEDKPARPKAVQKSRAKSGPSRQGHNMLNRPPKYDREKIAAMFRDGLTVAQIAKAVGAHRGTVSIALTEAGFDPKERTGPKSPHEVCGAGLHSMETHGKPCSGTKGGRYCSECKRIRERKKV